MGILLPDGAVEVFDGNDSVRDITKGAFYGRLTHGEAVDLELAAETDANVRVFDKRINYRTHVNLDFPELIEGLDYLVQQGIFTVSTVEKLRADGELHELYRGQ